jgi:autotransporter family porin
VLRDVFLGTAAVGVFLFGYGRQAYAGSCSNTPFNYICSGPADALDTTENLGGAAMVTVTTSPDFGIDTSATGGNAFTINADGGLTFTDENASEITGADYGVHAENQGSGDLSITTSGSVVGVSSSGIRARNYGANTTISAVDVSGGYHGIYAINNGTGSVQVTTTGMVTADTLDAIIVKNVSGTTVDVTAGPGAVYGNRWGVYVRNYGTDLTV